MYEHQRYSGLSKTRNAYCWEGLELSSGTSFAANIVEPNRVNQNCFQQSATDPAKEAPNSANSEYRRRKRLTNSEYRLGGGSQRTRSGNGIFC
eukprot:scaffold827_cov137-Skeletonema_marinoi.AAC.4